jgi:hypothetical protein
MTPLMKHNEASNPSYVRLLGSPAIVPRAYLASDAIEQLDSHQTTTPSSSASGQV